MDNEDQIEPIDQIKDLVLASKYHFLRDLQEEISRQKFYDLNAEFAKTKKNKNYVIIITLFVFVLIVILAAFFVTRYIQKENENITVNIDAFRDVNLRDVLDKAKEYEREMELAIQRRSDLEAERDRLIKEVNEEAQRKVDILAEKNLTTAEYQNQRNKIIQDTEARVDEIKAEYALKIDEVNQEIAVIQEKINEYDSKMLEQARKQEEVLDNQKRLFDLKMEETTTYYENKISQMESDYTKQITELKEHHKNITTVMKDEHERVVRGMENEHERTVNELTTNYENTINELTTNYEEEINDLKAQHTRQVADLKASHAREITNLHATFDPIFQKELYKRILASTPRLATDKAQMTEFNDFLEKEGVISASTYQGQKYRIDELDLLVERMQEIPYKNSMVPSLEYIDSLFYLFVDQYEDTLGKTADRLTYKNDVIADLRMELSWYVYAVGSYLRQNREVGFILDSRDEDKIIAYVDPAFPLREGHIGYVFRTDEIMIGVIRFYREGNRHFARVIKYSDDERRLQSFDKVLLFLE